MDKEIREERTNFQDKEVEEFQKYMLVPIRINKTVNCYNLVFNFPMMRKNIHFSSMTFILF